VCGQRHAPVALSMGKTRYPLHRRLGGPQDWSGSVRKILPSPELDLRTIQRVASRYTDCANLSHQQNVYVHFSKLKTLSGPKVS
jgi:hypothetical protein